MMLLSFPAKFGGLIAAAALAGGLAGAAPAATLGFNVLPADPAGIPKTTATGGPVLGNDATGAAGNYGNLDDRVTSVPAPAAGLLLLTAVGAVSALRRRKPA